MELVGLVIFMGLFGKKKATRSAPQQVDYLSEAIRNFRAGVSRFMLSPASVARLGLATESL